jgi:acyl-CoA reductase-like NAD-dependent aldehyde dehydrogenase
LIACARPDKSLCTQRQAVTAPKAQCSGSTDVSTDVSELLLIGGAWVPARSGRRLTTLDPATGAPLGTVADAGADDVDAAVAAATRAFGDAAWRDLTPAARARLLWRVGDLIEENADELARRAA